MSRSPARLAWYRLRATFRRRLAGYLALAFLVGLIGEVAMASVGIAFGRPLWRSFARQLSAVPDPVVPAASIALAAVAALALANLVAAVPGRRAARTPAAEVLRTE